MYHLSVLEIKTIIMPENAYNDKVVFKSSNEVLYIALVYINQRTSNVYF